MIPQSKRMEDSSIQMIFEMMMAFSLIDLDMKEDRVRPNIIIVLNNFSTDNNEVENSDGHDKDEPTGEYWLNSTQNAIWKFLAFKI